MGKGSVFISYRRDDATGFSHAIRDRLIQHIPADRIFMDVAGIDAGADFARRIDHAVNECDVLLALIGRRWAGDPNGPSRFDDSNDWVRAEIASALRRGVRVIPVLLDGAPMPSPESLPEDVRGITRLNASELRGTRLNADSWDLTGTILQSLGKPWPPPEPGDKIYSITAGIYAFCTGGAILLMMIASSFLESVPTTSYIAVALAILNTAILLRLPMHPAVRRWPRSKVLRIGAVAHIAAFLIAFGAGDDLEFGMVLLFGIIPTALLFLASYAVQRRALMS